MIDLLKRYFERRGDVALAFLFGSSARGLDRRDSDVDIAIYLTEKGEEDRIWREVSRTWSGRSIWSFSMMPRQL